MTASFPRLSLQSHQPIERRPAATASIHDVTELHEMARAPDPSIGLVG
jgi:hypothetical protein